MKSFCLSGGSTTISSYSDIEKFRTRCGPAHGVMLCQAAMWNPSIFRPNGLLPISDVAKRFLEIVKFLFLSFVFENEIFLSRALNLIISFLI
jgi:tRNA-dihydrouridine synthase